MRVTRQLLNVSFIFDGIKYAKPYFYHCFHEFDLYASRRFWKLYFPKKVHFDFYVNQLIGEYVQYLTAAKVYIDINRQ